MPVASSIKTLFQTLTDAVWTSDPQAISAAVPSSFNDSGVTLALKAGPCCL